MKYIKLGGACLNQTPLAFEENTSRIVTAINRAREAGVQILCIPELAISGYGCEDAFFSDYVISTSLHYLKEIAKACQNITVSVGLPMEYDNCLYNVVCLIHNTQILGFVAKQELAGDGIYYEPRWFKPWQESLKVDYLWEGNSYPFGDLLFEVGGIRIGFEICEDAWTGIRPAQRHYLNNVDIILNPSASNFSFGKSKVRERLVTEASRSYNCTYIYSNLLGNEAGRIIYDGEILIAQGGELLARNKRFSFEEIVISTAVVDVDRVHIYRRKSFNYLPEIPQNLIVHQGDYDETNPDAERKIAAIESKEEEFYEAVTLALFDYMRKSKSRGFVLSLSGGADSSACAVLCAKAIERARAELGEEAFWDRLAYLNVDTTQALLPQICTYIYQGTENSSDHTLQSASELAKGLGVTFHYWDVQKLYDEYTALVSNSYQRTLSWEEDDIALQNIQARLRAPGIWMMTNIQRGLLITTSNRSEAAVGYATMDGDTSGGLAPLGGMDKASLISWLSWAETYLDIPALQFVNSLKPTAELRPSTADQSDEKDLMPYDILDKIETCAIRDYQSPVEVFRTLRGVAPDDQLQHFVRKFFLLWSRNQWKRERYAPSFHLDDKNLDPKTWCRFPILNDGYGQALAELDQYVASLKSFSEVG